MTKDDLFPLISPNQAMTSTNKFSRSSSKEEDEQKRFTIDEQLNCSLEQTAQQALINYTPSTLN